MNQILFNKDSKELENNTVVTKDTFIHLYKFKILLFLCLVALISLIFYYFYFWHNLNNKEEISDTLKHNFTIQQVYSKNPNSTSEPT